MVILHYPFDAGLRKASGNWEILYYCNMKKNFKWIFDFYIQLQGHKLKKGFICIKPLVYEDSVHNNRTQLCETTLRICTNTQ